MVGAAFVVFVAPASGCLVEDEVAGWKDRALLAHNEWALVCEGAGSDGLAVLGENEAVREFAGLGLFEVGDLYPQAVMRFGLVVGRDQCFIYLAAVGRYFQQACSPGRS